MERSLVTLIGAPAANDTRARVLSAHAAFVEQPDAFAGVFAATEASCLSLARAIADRLWLTPRFLSAGARGHALSELILTLDVQRLERTVLVLPESWIDDVLRRLEQAGVLVARTSAAPWLHELALAPSRALAHA